MKIALPLGMLAAAGSFVACGPPELTAVPDNPYSNDESAVVHAGQLTLVASRNEWYEQALSQVSTPVDLMIVNRSKSVLPVSLDEMVLVDERGRVYRALPAQTVVSRLFGGSPPPPDTYLEPEPVPAQQPPPGQSGEPSQEQQPPPPPSSGTAPPSGGVSPSQTLAPSLEPGILLVAGHSGGGGHGGGGGHAVGGARGGAGFGPRGGRGFYGGHGFYGGRGYGGFRGRFGYGYGGFGWGWGAPYWGWGGWGLGWFGPAYVVGLDTDDYYYPGYDAREFDHLGPWQVYQAALRPTDLKPNQRMGGLVFFEPAWNARFVTLRFTAHPESGPPVEMQARFEVTH